MISKLLLLFILATPILGKSFNYLESLIFFIVPLGLLLYPFNEKLKLFLPKKIIITQLVLIFLFILSTVFSKNIGTSYYQFFTFLNILLLVNLAVNIIKPKDFSFGLIIASLVYSIVFLLNTTGILHLNRADKGDNFILQVWGHSYVAEFLVLSIPLLLNQIFNSKKKIIWSIILIIVLCSIFLTHSRSALVALIIGLVFFKIHQKLSDKFKIGLIVICTIFFAFSFYQIYKGKEPQKTYTGARLEYWQEAIEGFKESPVFGIGPNNFLYINKKDQTFSLMTTSMSHSSLLNYLSENGLIFTLIFFGLITISLIKTFKINNLFFVCGLIALFFSLIDFSWSSPGILIISLYLIFYYPFSEIQKEPNKFSLFYIVLISFLILLFTISKTTSDILYLKGDYSRSITFDPFNLNSRLEIIKKNDIKDISWQKNINETIFIYNNNLNVYQALINVDPSAQKEEYYLKLISLNPVNIDSYISLLSYYQKNNLDKKIILLLQEIPRVISFSTLTHPQKIELSKIYYHVATKKVVLTPQESIYFFEKSVELIPGLAYYQIDLANIYWHTSQKTKASEQLKICLYYPNSKKQCQDYIDTHKDIEFDRPGRQEFIDYIDKKL